MTGTMHLAIAPSRRETVQVWGLAPRAARLHVRAALARLGIPGHRFGERGMKDGTLLVGGRLLAGDVVRFEEALRAEGLRVRVELDPQVRAGGRR